MSDAPHGHIDIGAKSLAGGWRLFAAAGVLALAALGAYWNSFRVPFLLDDSFAIGDNPSIRRLGQIGDVLAPPAFATTTGRPLLNLSFALNYAWGGLSVRGYHVVNWLIHVCAGLALLGIVRRTLLLPSLRGRYGASALPLAGFASLLWTLHPLQTESITYISQRAESLMGLFYLLTLYSFIRSIHSGLREDDSRIEASELEDRSLLSSLPSVKTSGSSWPGVGWRALSVAACLCGMATKQVMVTAPVLVLLYDRAFISGSFRSAWVNRRWYYAGLAASWLLLGFLMQQSSLAEVNAGFGSEVGWLSYAFTELRVVVGYLKLAFWPCPLVFDYGTEVYVADPLAVLPHGLALAAILAGVGVAWHRSPKVGFLGCCFFLILAPTSTVIPIAEQPMAESRMYLPLAALMVLAVLVIHTFFQRRAFVALGAAAIVLGVLTVSRNDDYRSEAGIWGDTIAKIPRNSRGHGNYGMALARVPGRLPEAIDHYRESLRIRPDFALAHNNIANAFSEMPGQLPLAIFHYKEALRLEPGHAVAHNNLANALVKMPGQLAGAIAHYEEALRLRPDYAGAHNNLANALARVPGRQAEAIGHYEEALRLNPDSIEAHCNLANTLVAEPGRLADAIAHYREVLRLNPGDARVHANLADALARTTGQLADAILHYEEAVRLKPDFVEVRNNLAVAYARTGRLDAAIEQLEAAARLAPSSAAIRNNLERMKANRAMK